MDLPSPQNLSVFFIPFILSKVGPRLYRLKVMSSVDEYMVYLKTIDWFAHTGQPLPAELSPDLTSRVSSWEEAVEWSQKQISFWCRIEAGNLLMAEVRANAPDRFVKWNDIARSNLPLAKSLLEENVLPRIPEPYRESAKSFVQSQLVGALAEVSFSDCSSVDLMRKHFAIYEKGFFPCGWDVASPESFPGKARVIVY